MKLKYSKLFIPVVVGVLLLTSHSCIGDLDADPIDPSTTMEFNQNEVFTKIYATLGLTGQKGPDGEKDIDGIDEGTSSFYRVIWYANQLIADETIVNSWNDAGLSALATCAWGSSNELVTGLYYRLTFDITLCNYFLEETEGIANDETIRQRAEVRFIRVLNYFYLMDLYANPPLMEKVTTEYPTQIKRADLFKYLEDDLLNVIIPDLAEPRTSTYGRVDKAAAWLLLARMYLNAEVYTGTANWVGAKDYAQKVLSSGYILSPTYKHLFMADNGGSVDGSTVNKASQEVILPILQDGNVTKSWGGSLFLIAGTHKDGMPDWGSTQQWGGPHCREAMVQKFFPNLSNAPLEATTEQIIEAANDDRAMMYSVGRRLSTGDNKSFEDGFSCTKFTNLRADGKLASSTEHVDMDIPFMRVAEAYLTLAEASVRANGGSSTSEAKGLIDDLRERSNATKKASYSLDDILDEWSREFWFEGRRRMDLVRFNKFGGNTNYNWDWKGGVKEGMVIQAYRNIFPIPANDLNANPNLVQNPNY